MFKTFFALFFALLLTGCAATLTEPATPSTQTVAVSRSSTASLVIPALTVTVAPGETSFVTQTATTSPTPETPNPLFTPTFDVRTIVTVTPAPKGECPNEDPAITIDLTTPDDDRDGFKMKRDI